MAELFVIESRLNGGEWEPSTDAVCRTHAGAQLELADFIEDVADLDRDFDYRITRYVPEDPTPGLLAAWQDEHRGQVAWHAEPGSILCVLVADDARRAVGHSTPLDPFGAARVALAAWAAKWAGE